MRLQDLLDAPGLHLRLLHDEAGARARAIRCVHTTDLLDPGQYLSGGELVATGLVWHTSSADSEAFVAAVAAGDAVGLAAGDARFGGIPEDLVDACRRHHLPLIEVPTEVSFTTLVECVAASVTSERHAGLVASLGRQRRLLSAVAEGRALGDLAHDVSEATGHTCRILTPLGRGVVPGLAPLDAADIDRLVRAFLTATGLPALSEGVGRPTYSLFPVGAALRQPLTSWFVVVEGDWRTWEPEIIAAIGELAAIAALDRARQSDGVRALRHLTDEVISLVDAGHGGRPETAVRLRQAGLDPKDPLFIVLASFPDSPALTDSARRLLDDVCAHLGVRAAATMHRGQAAAILPASEASLDRMRTAVARLAPALRSNRLALGVSTAAEPGLLTGALEEARYALRAAELEGGPVSVGVGEDLTSYVRLLAAVPEGVRRPFAKRTLGDVVAYDEAHHADLIATLQSFLECSGSWSRTAAALHLHVNTVRYRIGRIEELTGRDLRCLPDQVDLLLALHSR